MKDDQDIEVRLERSLGKQIVAPQLGREFNDAVWARIAKADALETVTQKTLSPRALAASRWLAVSNTIGITVALVIAAYFGARALGISNLPVGDWVSLPQISAATMLQWMTQLGYLLGAVALAYGLRSTSIGRRIRATFG
jgi:hypothetical protein